MGIVNKSKIREVASGYNVSKDFEVAIDKKIESVIKKSAVRAESNGRKTLQAKDI